MSELDTVVASLVAAEVKKQLGERNSSLPYVKRAAVTADEWKRLVIIETWDLFYKGKTVTVDHDGVEWYQSRMYNHTYIHDLPLADAAFNVNAPARFGKLDLQFKQYPEYFEVVELPIDMTKRNARAAEVGLEPPKQLNIVRLRKR